MTRFMAVFSFTTLVLAICTCFAQERTPSVVFEKPSQDLGKVTQGEIVRHVFKFTNKGDATLEITKVEPACGCTAAVLSAKEIAPGQSGQIEVSIKTEGMTALSKTVTVTTNDPKQREVVLTVTAIVEPEFRLSEPSIFLGSNRQGTEVSKELTVTIPPGKTSRITSVESTDKSVAVKMEPVADSDGMSTKVVASQKADAKVGYHFGFVVLKTTSSLTPVLKIPVRGTVSAP